MTIFHIVLLSFKPEIDNTTVKEVRQTTSVLGRHRPTTPWKSNLGRRATDSSASSPNAFIPRVTHPIFCLSMAGGITAGRDDRCDGPTPQSHLARDC